VTLGKYGPVTPEFARKLALQCLCDMAQGIDPNRRKRLEKAKSLTVRQAFELFFQAKESQLSRFTVQNYRLSDSLYLAGWANLPIREVTRQMVLKEHRRISIEHGASTANNVFRHLRSIFNFIAASQEDFPPNPVTVLAQARAWNPERRRRTLIAVHNLPVWWQAVMEEEACARDLLRMGLFTGMRRRELTTLRWDDVDLVGRALHLSKTKNGDPFSLPMSNALAEIISARRNVIGQTEWVFPGIGKTGHLAETKSIVKRVANRSGVPFAMHDLRRTFITIAESLDIASYTLKHLLNHRAETDVTGGYIIIDTERLRAPVERIAARISQLACK
jgi:integrase